MITFLCLFFPPALSVFLYEKIMKERLDRHSILGLYCFDAVAVNMICFAIKRFILGTAHDSMADLSAAAGMNYLIMAMCAAVAIAFVCVFAGKNIDISKEEEDEAQ